MGTEKETYVHVHIYIKMHGIYKYIEIDGDRERERDKQIERRELCYLRIVYVGAAYFQGCYGWVAGTPAPEP